MGKLITGAAVTGRADRWLLAVEVGGRAAMLQGATAAVADDDHAPWQHGGLCHDRRAKPARFRLPIS